MVGSLRAARMLDHALTSNIAIGHDRADSRPARDMLRAVNSWRAALVSSCPRQPANKNKEQGNTRRVQSYIIKTSSAVSPAARTPRVPIRVKLSFP